MKRWLLVVAIGLGVTSCGVGATSSSSSSAIAIVPASASPVPSGTADASAAAAATSPTATPTTPAATPAATPAPTTAPPAPTAPSTPAGVAMPNPAMTPGEAFPNVTTAQVCTSGYASSVRHVDSTQYREVYGAYRIPYPEPSGTYELDHLIPLELGGDNTNANLWPEPANPTPGFHQKDTLENTLHNLVCTGRLDLVQAQHDIATDWYAAYVRYVAP